MADGYGITVLTLFPELVEEYFRTSIVGKAADRGALIPKVINIRDFSQDRHRSCDDAPYGGGAGMVLMAEPLATALDSVDAKARHVVFPTPSGRPFRQRDALRLSRQKEIVLICGRYEGIDQRIVDEYVDEEFTIGDYVLSSGELAAMVVIDAVYRLREGMLRPESVLEDSFQDGLLEHPHYTRPEVFRSRKVPEILLSGHHARIAQWRREQQVIRTARNRPDLLQNLSLTEAEQILTESILEKESHHGCN
ncbi:tRNA (guanine37-N1)-methyltransferase [Alkalispirochaeta americana]|uniref:tRNA (guanine-N(1)-)-methyltransferase n=1 Tax=Alkalispirochaeta americana TaxID=159291 RepID=A0A1N6X3I6_9SPIO|nr:tRNA (guanosine(37)-N1)-methyltransferase TrmD [Alkalispirochaeta americana]SIQ96934.1 tRNA (guanine37-N1)-methyltransferase [Alkalispirochaeta americana]